MAMQDSQQQPYKLCLIKYELGVAMAIILKSGYCSCTEKIQHLFNLNTLKQQYLSQY